ncbi:protein of unknown function [Micropruina glycogenica]|uniref:Uncharacterized protein n=1 Tax=Micropruina glycogenica TaxID=75385 RepID=A0A2N9JK32_9ACTN|nr:protein of unknown function [Micropruina glycogenica]
MALAPSTVGVGKAVGQPNVTLADPSPTDSNGPVPPPETAICAATASGRSTPSTPRVNVVDGVRHPDLPSGTRTTDAEMSATSLPVDGSAVTNVHSSVNAVATTGVPDALACLIASASSMTALSTLGVGVGVGSATALLALTQLNVSARHDTATATRT